MCNACVERPAGLYVQDVLEPGHELYILESRPNRPPFYQGVNMGPRVEALPTLVSFPGSRAYKEGAAGVLHLRGTSWLDPSSYTDPAPMSVNASSASVLGPHVPPGSRRLYAIGSQGNTWTCALYRRWLLWPSPWIAVEDPACHLPLLI